MSIRISDSAELIESIPQFIGYIPSPGDITVLAVKDDSQTASVNLALSDFDQYGEGIYATLEANGADSAILVAYTDRIEGNQQLRNDLSRAFLFCPPDINVLDVLMTDGEHYRSLWCAEDCCPPEGRKIVKRNRLAAALVEEGELVAPEMTRAQLAEHITKVSRGRLKVSEMKGKPATAGQCIAVMHRHTPQILSFVARMGLGLDRLNVRDECWAWIEQQKRPDPEPWLALAKMLPDKYRPTPLFIYAWANWRKGHGSHARIALDELLRIAPNYLAAGLLDKMLVLGVNPNDTERQS